MTQSGHTDSNLCARSFFCLLYHRIRCILPLFLRLETVAFICFEAVEIKINLQGNSSRNRDAILMLRQCRAIIYHIMFFFVKERIGEPDFQISYKNHEYCASKTVYPPPQWQNCGEMKKSPFLFLCEFVHIVISAAILVMCDAVDADVILENEDVIWASRSNLNIDTYVRNTICMPT